MTWLKDLAFGQHWERIAQQLLPVGEEVVEMPSGKFPDWDFRTTARTYEVKADRRAAETGNFFVEFECSGRGSGVATTKADMWNLFLVRSEEDYELYEIEPAVLKRLCLECRVASCDGKNKGWLLPVSMLGAYRVALTLS